MNMKDEYITLELHKIFEMLSKHCTSDASVKMALEIEPSNDLETVKSEVTKVFDSFNASSRFGSPQFLRITDVSVIAKRAQSGSQLSLRDFLDVSKMLSQTESLLSWRKQFQNENFSLDYLFECLSANRWLQDKIMNAVLSEEELSDNASSQLASIRRKIATAGSKIRDTLERMIKSSDTQSYLQENIITMRDGRYVLPVKSECKNSIAGLVHDTSSSGQTYFIEPMAVVEANNEIRILKGKEQEEIQRIIAELTSDCADFAEQLISDYNATVELNLYFAKANLGAEMNASKPRISDDGEIILKKARHPLIDKDKVVPIDFAIGSEFDSLIITGPNTGGKTVILKTVGLLTLMTMCGLLIPVSDGSKITVFDDILVDIGDKQSIEESLSTFSSHIVDIVEILERVNYRSLVLIDELGSGTDPVEGAALAVAIIERIKMSGAKLVTTTHYQELKMYALETEGVENASCEFDLKTLQPTYRLVIGSPGKSNAFAISKRLGIDGKIIERAGELMTAESQRFENTIERLEAARQEYEGKALLADKYQAEAQRLRDELRAERDKYFSERDKELEKSRREARELIDRLNAHSRRLMNELEELKKAKDKEDFSAKVQLERQKYKSEIDSLYSEASKLGELKAEEYKPPRPYKKGDDVIIQNGNKTGILISTPDSSGNCMVQVGIMKTKVHVSLLRLADNSITFNNKSISKKQGSVSTVTESRATRKAETELDIRGYTVDEGLYELDSFVDRAIMSGNKTIMVIHGKGTGALKNAVRTHLKKHPSVQSVRKGVYGEGEDGVTVAELK